MFKALMICAIFGLAVAAVHQVPHAEHHVEHHAGGSHDDVHAEVLSQKVDVRHDGFDASLETSNHIIREDHGNEHGQHGAFSWISPEGQHVDIKYTADENGYHPEGDVIPVIPEHVHRLIEYNAAHSHEDVHSHGHDIHH
ncbi:larval cuticle protein 1-like [Drosophila innubila]|uniref:larval cuticle protein 1-like n=1 Tax=Drosophila innubila TaxID=198719 RepID=UPI00148E7AE7|nr:larval cuticle protein 1-like [Drosophila innubila]